MSTFVSVFLSLLASVIPLPGLRDNTELAPEFENTNLAELRRKSLEERTTRILGRPRADFVTGTAGMDCTGRARERDPFGVRC